MKIYKPVILKKLGLSEKFPQKILYARKTASGVRILKQSTIIVIFVLKLYLEYKHCEDKIAEIISINEENARLQYGYKEHIIETATEDKPNRTIQSISIGEIMKSRRIKLININHSKDIFSTNKIIMD